MLTQRVRNNLLLILIPILGSMATGTQQQQQQQQPVVIRRPRVVSANQRKRNDDNDVILCDVFRSKEKVVDDPQEEDPAAKKKCVIIFLHGFSGNRQHLQSYARSIIQQASKVSSAESSSSSSIVVEAFLPDSIPLTEGGTFKELWIDHNVRSAQLANVEQVIDHVKFVSPFEKLILVGHSAGGAIALEVAVALQNKNTNDADKPASMVVLLDAVPWIDTINLAPQLDVQKTRLVSFRCEPSSWNKQGIIEKFISAINKDDDDDHNNKKDGGSIVDVKIVGAKHGDALPPMFMGRCMGIMTAGGFDTMSELTNAALLDGLATSISSSQEKKDDNGTNKRHLETAIKSLEEQGKLVNMS